MEMEMDRPHKITFSNCCLKNTNLKSHNIRQFMSEKVGGCPGPKSCPLHARPVLGLMSTSGIWDYVTGDTSKRQSGVYLCQAPRGMIVWGRGCEIWRVVARWNASPLQVRSPPPPPSPSVLCSKATHSWFVHLGGESHRERKVSCPRTEHLCLWPGLHAGPLIWSPVHQPYGHCTSQKKAKEG